MLLSIVVTAAFAALACFLKMVGKSGAIGGFVFGAVIFFCTGWPGFTLLALFVVGGALLTRLGYERKNSSGNAQEYGGRRGAKNALANCSVAAIVAVLYAATGAEAFAAAFVASLGAAFADTVESEVGQLYGGTSHLITSLRPVMRGTDGAITALGTFAGAIAASMMSLAGLALGFVDGFAAFVLVAIAAFVGTVVDSVIGAKLPRIGNEATNIACTFAAAVLTLLLL
ncbi:MAG: DUF92 domain-containing protein [Rubrobacter sp.]